MRSFFLGDNPVEDGTATISGELYRHMARVLRLKEGAAVTLVDAGGRRLVGEIGEVAAKSLTVRIDSVQQAPAEETGLRVTLYQGMPKGEKLDLILQKCTELGIAEVVVFDAARSVVKLKGERGGGKLERCQRIVQEAARQSGRSSAPAVAFAGALGETLAGDQAEVKLLLWEGEQTRRLRETLDAAGVRGSVAIVIGPEGGLAPEEVEAALSARFQPVSLGRRILRTETAGLAALAILQFYWGDMG